MGQINAYDAVAAKCEASRTLVDAKCLRQNDVNATCVKVEDTPCHTQFLCQNQVLIVCMTQDQMFHTYGQKGLYKTKCHNIKFNYYTNIVFID
jgi:hypothetical protein